MKTWIPRRSGPWFSAYRVLRRQWGLVLTWGPDGWAASGGCGGGAMLVGWKSRKAWPVRDRTVRIGRTL